MTNKYNFLVSNSVLWTLFPPENSLFISYEENKYSFCLY